MSVEEANVTIELIDVYAKDAEDWLWQTPDEFYLTGKVGILSSSNDIREEDLTIDQISIDTGETKKFGIGDRIVFEELPINNTTLDIQLNAIEKDPEFEFEIAASIPWWKWITLGGKWKLVPEKSLGEHRNIKKVSELDLGINEFNTKEDFKGGLPGKLGWDYIVSYNIAVDPIVVDPICSDVEDPIYNNLGNNSIVGTVDDDTLYGDLYGVPSNDTIWGDEGNDTIWAGSGNDTIWAGSGNDTIWAGSGNDKLYGDNQHDKLYGDFGNDTLHGGEGDDTLYGYAYELVADLDYIYNVEMDTLTGGCGADAFVIGSNFNTDPGPFYFERNLEDKISDNSFIFDTYVTITDFNSKQEDKILVYGDILYESGSDPQLGISDKYSLTSFNDGMMITYQDDWIAHIANTTDVDINRDFEIYGFQG